MPKSAKLRTSKQFKRVARDSKKHFGSYVCICVHQKVYPQSRLGITVSKRYGNAVRRNRFKRCVREAFRLLKNKLPLSIDINIKPKGHLERICTWGVMGDLERFIACNCKRTGKVSQSGVKA